MTNVIFEVRVHSECAALRAKADSYESKTISDASFMNSICEATIERFAGSSVIRESFRITFKADYVLYKQSFSYFTKTRFFLALRGLTGFKQVTVVLKWSVISGSDYRYEVRKGVKHVQLGLLRDLGPADIKNAAYKVDEVGETSTYFFVELEFQPLKHHLRRLRVEAITCGDFECSCGIDEGGE